MASSSRTRSLMTPKIIKQEIDNKLIPIIILSDSESDTEDVVAAPAPPANFPYTWNVKVTKAMANRKKVQVLHFPKGEISKALGNITRVRLRSEDSKFNFSAFIITAERNKEERYIGKSWYEYVWYHKPKLGDVLVFTLTRHKKLYVKLHRRQNRLSIRRK